MKKYIAEFIGTFCLIFAGTGAVVINQASGGAVTHVGIAITFGLVVMAMIYTFGPISGAHMNPAVTVALAVAKKFPVKDIAPYALAQLAGALLASGTLKFLFPENDFLGATMPAGSEAQSLILEFILTFILMIVIMNVAFGSPEQGMFAGVVIGAVILLEALFAGPICGASMNPTRSLAPAIMSGHLEHIWLYIAGPVLGAVSAVLVWYYLSESKELA